MLFDQSNVEISRLYESRILNEFAPSMVNGVLEKDSRYDDIYLLCSYDKEGIIDTIYEIYISVHSDQRSVQRNCSKEQMLNYMDTCLECVPIEQLNVPFNQQRHVVFDMLNENKLNSGVTSLPCIISAMKETELTTLLKGKYPKVVVCDIIIKTVVQSKIVQYSNQDINNAAIHIPVASSGQSIDLENVLVGCNTPVLNNLMQKGFDVEPIEANGIKYSNSYKQELQYSTRQLSNRPEQYIFHYADFFEALHQLRIIHQPVKLCFYFLDTPTHDMDVTNGKNREILKFACVDDIKLTLNSNESGIFDIRKSPIDYQSTKNTNNHFGNRKLNRLKVNTTFIPQSQKKWKPYHKSTKIN